MLVRVSQRKMFFRHMVAFLLPIGLAALLSFFAIFSINRNLAEKNRRIYEHIAAEMGSVLSGILTESRMLLYAYSTDVTFFNDMRNILRKDHVSYEELRLIRSYQNSLEIAVKSRPYIHSLYCIPFYAGEAPLPIMTSADGIVSYDNFWDRTLVKTVLENHNDDAPSFRSRTENHPFLPANGLLTYYVGATSIDRRNHLGYAVLNLDVRLLQKKLEDLLSGKPEILYRVTSGTDILFSTINPAEAPLTESHVRIRGETYREIAVHTLENTLELHVWVADSALRMSQPGTTAILLATIIGSIIVGLGASYLVTRKKYSDVVLFSDYLNAIDDTGAANPLPEPIDLDNVDASVIKEFFLKDYINLHISQRELKERKLELEILRKQLNPHFLVNTLQMINWKIIRELHGYSEINKTIENLIKILSYSLYPAHLLVPLKEEVDYTRTYITLYARKTERPINIIWNIPQGYYSYLVPRQIFQPLVENIFIHAFPPEMTMEEETPAITIGGGLHHGNLRITIQDNGTGISPDIQKKLHMALQSDDYHPDHVGIGIHNTHKRISLLFGKRFGLQIDSAPGKGSTFSIMLPRIVRETPRDMPD